MDKLKLFYLFYKTQIIIGIIIVATIVFLIVGYFIYKRYSYLSQKNAYNLLNKNEISNNQETSELLYNYDNIVKAMGGFANIDIIKVEDKKIKLIDKNKIKIKLLKKYFISFYEKNDFFEIKIPGFQLNNFFKWINEQKKYK